MDDIRQYLLSVVSAAVISALAINVIGKKGIYASVVKLLAGLFLSITVISPWAKLQIGDLSSYLDNLELDAADVIAKGEYMAADAAGTIIKDQLEAYILDKASAIGIQVKAEVVLTDTDPPVPCSVTISGAASPYAKQRLQQMIADELGIPKENQSWM